MSPRPDLPFKQQNPHIASLDLSELPPVKYQSLDRGGHEIVVGRMKIPTPSGHAFILRRFDTGAISLTTMFRAAFPTASEADERCETIWVKETYDLGGNNDSTKEPGIVRLAGTWVGPDVALLPEFAQTYGLGGVIPHIAKAIPDPSAAYRRASTKTTPKAEPRSSPSANSNLPTPQDKSNAGATETGAGILIQALPTTHIILTSLEDTPYPHPLHINNISPRIYLHINAHPLDSSPRHPEPTITMRAAQRLSRAF